jgi:aquaporin TIP
MATKLMQKFVDSYDDAGQQDAGCVRAVLAEFVLTFLFVFTVVSAAMGAGNPLPPVPGRRPSPVPVRSISLPL